MTALSMDADVLEPWPDLTGPSDLPGHARIAYWLERLIVSRKLRAGDKHPSEVEIAAAVRSALKLKRGDQVSTSRSRS